MSLTVKNPILSFPCTVHYTHIDNKETQRDRGEVSETKEEPGLPVWVTAVVNEPRVIPLLSGIQDLWTTYATL
ncbi:hypothetical protein GBAR_LOCUS14715 [Geodia barretti]|uniref:Uncharacterized protein n=1 Tax=Geodia barretti TaxID=519541 RepID=A0AA35WM49_GEOBA|nr:hypothetical protein GBAR_LOCUS14715 [Geodia barretti]